MTGKCNGAGVGVFCAAALVLLTAGTTAKAQSKGLSDESVVCLMSYAWTMIPPKFTTPEGKIIEIDKTKRKEVVVPIEIAREVTRVARISAFAAICDLAEEQVANYRTLMKREEAKKIWSDQQLHYINQLHLTTYMLLTGRLEATSKDTGVKSPPNEPIELCSGVTIRQRPANKVNTCTESEREKLRTHITSYINAAPDNQSPAKTAEPKGPQKK